MSMPDDIPAQVEGGTVIVGPVGELDLAVAAALRTALERALHVADEGVRVDLAAVTFVDSTALAAFVDTWRAAQERELTFCVQRPAPNVLRVLTITGLDRLLCGP